MVTRNRVLLLATATALLASPSISAAGKAVVATSSTSSRIIRSNVDRGGEESQHRRIQSSSSSSSSSHGHLRHKKHSANNRPRHDRQSQPQSQSQSRQRNLFFFTWITTSPTEPEDAAVDTAGVDSSTSPAPSTSVASSTTSTSTTSTAGSTASSTSSTTSTSARSTTTTTAAEDASITLGTVPLHHDGHIHNDVNLEGGTVSATIISQETGEVISVTLNDDNNQNSDNNNNSDIEATMIATFPTMPMEETSTTAATTTTKTTEGPTTNATVTMTTKVDSGESFDWIDVNGNGDESFNIVLDEEILDVPPPSFSSSSSCHSDADCPASKPTCLDLSNGACFFPPCGTCVEEQQQAAEVGEEEVQEEAGVVEQDEPEEAAASTISVLDEVSQRLPPTTTTTTTTTVELNGDIEMDTDVDILPTGMETGPGTLATSSGSTVGSTTETMAPVTRTTSPPPKTESSRESPTNTVAVVDVDIVPDIPMDSTTSTGFATSTATAVIASTVTDGTDAAEMDSNGESTSSPPTEGIVTIPATTSFTSVIPQVDIEIDGLDSIAEDVDPNTNSQSDAPTISLDAKEQEAKETSEATRPATVFATFRNVEEGEEGMSPEGELELEGSIPTETTPAAIITTTEAATATSTNNIVSWPSGERLGDYTSCGFTCCTNDDCAAGGGCCMEGKCVVDDIATAEAMNGLGSEERCGAVIGPPADVVCGYDAWLAFEMDGNCV